MLVGETAKLGMDSRGWEHGKREEKERHEREVDDIAPAPLRRR
jgi:hypothetical protein